MKKLLCLYEYKGKKGTYIKVLLHSKPLKGYYKKDIIEVDILSKTNKLNVLLTKQESLILASGLLHAVVCKLSKEK